jgi:hypothetical protein
MKCLVFRDGILLTGGLFKTSVYNIDDEKLCYFYNGHTREGCL